MNFFNKTTNWLGHQGSKLFIDTKNPAVRMQEKALWMRFCKNGINIVFALRNKNLDMILSSIGDSLTCREEWDDLKTLSKFIEGNNQLEIADIGNDEYHIYHNNGEWFKIRVENNGQYNIFYFDKEDRNHMKFCGMSLGAVLMDLHKYLSPKEMEEIIDEENYDDWMKEEGIVGWCENSVGVAVKLAKYHEEYTGDFPDYIIILNKQYVYKLKQNEENNLLYLMPHSKQEDLVKVGTEKDIIDYLEEKLNKAMSN